MPKRFAFPPPNIKLILLGVSPQANFISISLCARSPFILSVHTLNKILYNINFIYLLWYDYLNTKRRDELNLLL